MAAATVVAEQYQLPDDAVGAGGTPEPDEPGALAPAGTVEELAQLTAFRDISPHARTLPDADCLRFIRATGGHLNHSAKRLAATCAWRESVKPETVCCSACASNPKSHYMHIAGLCKEGRPIIYSCLALASNKDFEDNKAHMIQTFEMAVKCMRGSPTQQWIWVCDFHGFGIADCNPRLAKLFLDMSAEHYPERLGLFLVVGAPALFGVLWNAISHFVDPKTYRKIRFLPFDWAPPAAGAASAPSPSPPSPSPSPPSSSALEAEMLLHFSPATTAWMLAEMAENRDKKKVPLKPYNYYTVYESALQGQLCDQKHHLPAGGPGKGKGEGEAAAAAGGVEVVAEQEEVAGALGGLGLEDSSRGNGGRAAATKHHHHHSRHPSCLCGSGVHDPRGTPELLHLYNTAPDLLLPQALCAPLPAAKK